MKHNAYTLARLALDFGWGGDWIGEDFASPAEALAAVKRKAHA